MMKNPSKPALVFIGIVLMMAATSLYAQFLPFSWNNPPEESISGISHKTFFSKSIGGDVGYNILLPPEYETSTESYPVIYSLHGAGGNENHMANATGPIIWEALELGTIPSVIVVFVNGGPLSFYADSPDGEVPSETVFISELIPHIDATYRTIPERQGRGIEGMSMGGFGALSQGMKHPGLFGSVVAYAPPLPRIGEVDGVPTFVGGSTEPPPLAARRFVAEVMFGGDPTLLARYHPVDFVVNQASTLSRVLPVRIVYGTSDGVYQNVEEFRELMLANDYDLEHVVLLNIGHNTRDLYTLSGVEGIRFHVRMNEW